jgi:hypothetical protein
VVDYRGYGQSSGAPSLRRAIEDAPAVWRFARSQTTLPLVVMGRSLGSACAAELAGALGQALAAAILESGFTDLRGVVRRRGIEPPAQFDADTLAVFDPLPKWRRATAPVVVIHGSADTLIPPDEGRAAFDAAERAAARRLVLIEGRGHNDLSRDGAYWRAVGWAVDAAGERPART